MLGLLLMALLTIPSSPQEMRLPKKFTAWREGQPRVIQEFLESTERFVGQMQPVGKGKSLSYIACSLLYGGGPARTLILTSTKALQDQLLKDFKDIGLVEIKGKASYPCDDSSHRDRNCEQGYIGNCPYKGSTLCTWANAKQEALESSLVVTNYACWLYANKYSNGFGDFDLLVLDEAHAAAEHLAKAMQIQISENEIIEVLAYHWPERDRNDTGIWKEWAKVAHKRATMQSEKLEETVKAIRKPSSKMIRDVQHLRNLKRKLFDVSVWKPENWVPDTYMHGYQFDPTSVAEFGEKYLFRGIKKVLLTSGTIRPEMLRGLGIPFGEFEFFDYPSEADPMGSPLIYIPTAKIYKDSQPWQMRKLVRRIDETIEAGWGEYKGIIHTPSFTLRDFIKSESEYSRLMDTNYSDSPEPTVLVVNRFKEANPPRILISPSVSTGHDFPGDMARWQIIAKVPFADDRSKIEQARKGEDPKRGIAKAIEKIAQQYGRTNRGGDDWSVTFIFDEEFGWLWFRYSNLAPPWLVPCYRRMEHVPSPAELGR